MNKTAAPTSGRGGFFIHTRALRVFLKALQWN